MDRDADGGVRYLSENRRLEMPVDGQFRVGEWQVSDNRVVDLIEFFEFLCYGFAYRITDGKPGYCMSLYPFPDPVDGWPGYHLFHLAKQFMGIIGARNIFKS